MAERRIEHASFPPLRIRGAAWRPHEDLYHFVLERTWSQYFVLLAMLFVVANALFAVAYWASPGCVAGATSYADAFFFSVQTLGTIGYGAMSPVTTYGHVVVSLEAFVGMLGVAVVTGLTFAKFSRPTARVLFARYAVVHERDGAAHLVFRLANQRHNLIVEAQLRVMLLVRHVTKEGEELRTPMELPLVRDRSGVFVLTWIPMHRIDSTSPFFGPDALERLRAADAEIFLSLQGWDETLAQNVHARWRYRLDDIRWDARFADVLEVTPDGTRVVDYGKFHDVVPTKAP